MNPGDQATPEITNQFNSLPDIGWYGSAYLMTCGGFQLLFGKLYTFFDVKTVVLFSITFFEIGSAICGAAPNSVAFIVGRAIAGFGAAGILGGSVSVTVLIPLVLSSDTGVPRLRRLSLRFLSGSNQWLKVSWVPSLGLPLS